MTDIAKTNDTSQSVFQSSLSVEAKIERARTELLDFSARNRLLNGNPPVLNGALR
jgi:hypothetical protein